MAVQYIGARAHDYGKRSPEELFGDIRSAGWQAVQLALKKAIAGIDTMEDADARTVQRIGKALHDNHLHLAVLGSYIEPALVHDEKKREAGISDFLQNISIAKTLGADCVGTETTHTSDQPSVTRQEAVQTLCHSLAKMLTRAEEVGVDIAIEPVRTHTVNTPELAAQILKTMASPRLKIIFDPVNLLSADAVPHQDELWERSLDAFGGVIAAVHMKGVAFGGENRLASSEFSESVVHYPFLFERLQKLPQNFSVLRESANPAHGAADYAFLKRLCEKGGPGVSGR